MRTATGTRPVRAAEGRGRRVALVVSGFHEEIAKMLAAGARAVLLDSGVADKDLFQYEVAGVFELAPACRQIIAVGPEIDALVTLGAVIRGETPHFDFVARAAAEGLQELACDTNVAIGFGVLTTDTREQALRRASRDGLDKGGDAARAALMQAELYERLREGKPAVRGFRLS